jgi:RimJ/RimL family protein N-acetyltransferase
MSSGMFLRDVTDEDLPTFFEFQLDPEANWMAGFTARDPSDRDAFNSHWAKIMADASCIVKTIVSDGKVVGSVGSYEDAGKREVTYWIGREFWRKGIATWALSEFLLRVNRIRPIYARVAKDNIGSRRVLEKCGFKVIGETSGFANARGEEIEELLMELQAKSVATPA